MFWDSFTVSWCVLLIVDFGLSIACVVMGALHLNECQNQAATFLLANGGSSLALLLVMIVFVMIDLDFTVMLPFVILVKPAFATYGSIAIFGKFEHKYK